jgi:adenosylcobinamide-GDP ribazoletransferase
VENIFPPVILSIGLVLLMAVMTRALHLDGLGDTFDGLGARGGPKEALKAMRDSHTGIFGLTAVVAVLALKGASIDGTRELRPHALILAPVLGRWAMLLLAYKSESVAEGLGRIVVEYMNARHLCFGTAVTLVPTLVIAGTLGTEILLAVFSLAILMKIYFHRRLGGITGDHCGAVEEAAEALTFVIFAAVEWKRFKGGLLSAL